MQDALPDADERGAVEPLRRPPRRRAAGERHVRCGDRVLPPAPRGYGRGGEGLVARPLQLRRDQRDPARDEPQANRRGGVLGGVPERPAPRGLGDGGAAHRGRHRQQAQRTLPERDPRLGDTRHDVHRRAEDAPLLRRVRVERRFLRDRRRLRGVARPAAAVFHPRRREPDVAVEAPEDGPRRMPLRGPQGADGTLSLARIHTGRRRVHADRALPRRRELGPVDRGRVPVLPRVAVREHHPAEPRQVHRRVLEAHERVQEDGGRPRRTQLAHPEHPGPAGRAARHLRHELLEELCRKSHPHLARRQGVAFPLGEKPGGAPALRRTPHRRVPRQDRGARAQGRGVEDAPGGEGQPLVRRHRRQRRRRLDVRMRPRGDGSAGPEEAEGQGEALRTPQGA